MVLAHAAHWYEAVLYVVPAALTGAWIGLRNLRDKWGVRREAERVGADARRPAERGD